jgi:hypothetical protein
MGGKRKIKNIDSFQMRGDIFFTRALIPRMSSQKETKKLLESENVFNVDFDVERVSGNIEKNKSNLFSRGRKMDSFFTEDSKLYITPKEYRKIQNGIELNRADKNWDSLSSRIIKNYQKYHRKEQNKDVLYKALLDRLDRIKEDVSEKSQAFFGTFSMKKAWNFSIVAAILFGMFSMTLIYRYLGEGVSADKIITNDQAQEIQVDKPAVLGASDEKGVSDKTTTEAIQDDNQNTDAQNSNLTDQNGDNSTDAGNNSKYDSIEKMIDDKFGDETAIAIAMAESHLNSNAYHKNSDGSVDCGIFQINSVHNPTKAQCTNPKANIDLAYQIYQKRGYGAWTTFTDGKYKKYMQEEN